mmetsp:Transcript_4057/g.14328  ORF Transcript_4057/g.14328 Transcript_4057/m.14328 type:complete len:248 (-) Transcript_4057:508-1251(-)
MRCSTTGPSPRQQMTLQTRGRGRGSRRSPPRALTQWSGAVASLLPTWTSAPPQSTHQQRQSSSRSRGHWRWSSRRSCSTIWRRPSCRSISPSSRSSALSSDGWTRRARPAPLHRSTASSLQSSRRPRTSWHISTVGPAPRRQRRLLAVQTSRLSRRQLASSRQHTASTLPGSSWCSPRRPSCSAAHAASRPPLPRTSSCPASASVWRGSMRSASVAALCPTDLSSTAGQCSAPDARGATRYSTGMPT